ncbi:MAG: hypothetical protein QXY45_00235 [Candidatus Aenigmatarchaeota archaeon]
MKGVTGKIFTVIISLILALIGLVLIWIFLNKSTNIISEGVRNFMGKVKCELFCKNILGFEVGSCAGC